eukprot:TRINITY_DN6364_c1_g2_i2.p1 TRINITY_DN6364_c1_g2~~TRINITY_DN6364_c1_g2_i2.p1  ORF type:complete len:466 (+),score=146.66 TRINITY_DN6364_c1_g2_i2:203-1399(+)
MDPEADLTYRTPDQPGFIRGIATIKLADEIELERANRQYWETKHNLDQEYKDQLEKMAKERRTKKADALNRVNADRKRDYSILLLDHQDTINSIKKDIEIQKLFLNKRVSMQQAMDLHFDLIKTEMYEFKKREHEASTKEKDEDIFDLNGNPFSMNQYRKDSIDPRLKMKEGRAWNRHKLMGEKLKILSDHQTGKITTKEAEAGMKRVLYEPQDQNSLEEREEEKERRDEMLNNGMDPPEWPWEEFETIEGLDGLYIEHLRYGDGENFPTFGDSVNFYWSILSPWDLNTDTPMSSWWLNHPQRYLRTILGKNEIMPGLEVGVTKISLGGRARIWMSPEFSYALPDEWKEGAEKFMVNGILMVADVDLVTIFKKESGVFLSDVRHSQWKPAYNNAYYHL